MTTPEQWTDGIIKHIENPTFPGFTVLMPTAVIRDALIGIFAAAVNEALEEAADEIEKLMSGAWGAQTPARVVRAMKVKE